MNLNGQGLSGSESTVPVWVISKLCYSVHNGKRVNLVDGLPYLVEILLGALYSEHFPQDINSMEYPFKASFGGIQVLALYRSR